MKNSEETLCNQIVIHIDTLFKQEIDPRKLLKLLQVLEGFYYLKILNRNVYKDYREVVDRAIRSTVPFDRELWEEFLVIV